MQTVQCLQWNILVHINEGKERIAIMLHYLVCVSILILKYKRTEFIFPMKMKTLSMQAPIYSLYSNVLCEFSKQSLCVISLQYIS